MQILTLITYTQSPVFDDCQTKWPPRDGYHFTSCSVEDDGKGNLALRRDENGNLVCRTFWEEKSYLFTKSC